METFAKLVDEKNLIPKDSEIKPFCVSLNFFCERGKRRFLRVFGNVAGSCDVLDAPESKKFARTGIGVSGKLFESFVFAPKGSPHLPMRFPLLS